MDPVLVSSSPFEILHENKNPVPEALVFASSLTREVQVPADSYSDTNISFSFNPSQNTVIDRTVLIAYTVTLTLDAGTDHNILWRDSDISVSAFPFNRVCRSMEVNLNNNGKTFNPHQWIQAMNAYHGNNWFDEATLQCCPSQPDPINSIQASGRAAVTSLPKIGNSQFHKAAATIGTSSDRYTRGVWEPTSMARNGNRTVFTFQITEPLVHPLLAGFSERSSLANISSIRINLNMLNLGGMFQIGICKKSNDAPLAAQAAVVAFTSKPSLLFRVYTPSENIPKQVSMPYTDLTVRTFPIATTAPGASNSFATGQFTVPVVPEKLLIFARRRNPIANTAAVAGLEADGFGVISDLTVRTDADSGGLSAASLPQLYQMCRRNGSIQSFKEFSDYQGNPLLISLSASDLGGYIPGSMQPYTLDIQGKMKNTFCNSWIDSDAGGRDSFRINNAGNDQNTDMDLYVICLVPGKLVAADNMLDIFYGTSASAVQAAVAKGVSDVSFDEEQVMKGSGFWKDFKKGFRKGLKTTTGLISTGAKIGSVVAPEYAAAFNAAGQGADVLKAISGNGYRVMA